MLEEILNMYGPMFLLFYMLVCLLVIVVTRLVTAALQYESAPLPAVTPAPDPYQIAYLRGGPRAVTNLSLLQLVEEGYINVENGSLRLFQGAVSPPRSEARLIQTAVWSHFSSPQQRMVLPGIAQNISPLCTPLKRDLYHNGLLLNHNQRIAGVVVMAFAILVVAGLGVLKLITALGNGHYNVGFLIILLVIEPALVIRYCFPKQLSLRGQRYLRRLRTAYSKLRSEGPAYDRGSDITASLLAGAIFGVSTLEGAKYDPLTMFIKTPLHSGWSEGGGISSCASIGSCGGGSCGGGGCGGCGGGT